MAFDQPVEADSVGGMSFFSTLTRAPVIGALLWVLGDNDDDDNDDDDCQLEKEDDPILVSSDRSKRLTTSTTTTTKSISSPKSSSLLSSKDCVSCLKKAPPNLLGSSVSVSDHNEDDPCAVFPVHHYYGSSTSKKQLSWSDECGKELLQYGDESSPKSPVAQQQQQPPIRSAMMSKSRSVRGRLSSSTATTVSTSGSETARYLPQSLVEKRNHVVAAQAATPAETTTQDGMESPQWGWYIRTTPPTPEMYHSSRHKVDSATTTTVVAAPLAASNPVFQGLQDRRSTKPVWPSVPL